MISIILKYSIDSLFYGGLITVAFIALFIFLIKGWYKDAVFKPISFVILGILSLIVLWNSTIICGALAMKSDISSIQALIENVIAKYGLDRNMVVDTVTSNEIFQEVAEQHPILSYYANYCDFDGWTIAELPMTMCETLKDYLNGIIIKSLLWSLGFVLVGAIIVIKTLDKPSRRSYVRGRRERPASRTRNVASRNSVRRR